MTNAICSHELETWGLAPIEAHHCLRAEFDSEARLTGVFLIYHARIRRLNVSEDFAERLEQSEGYSDRIECPFARAKAFSCEVVGVERAA